MKNYWKMRGFSMFSVPYVYVDHSTYQAEQLLAQNCVKMRHDGEMARADSPYCVVFCKVAKRDTEKFEEALGKLENKMLLLGHRDYPEVCNEIAKLIEEGMKTRKKR